MHINTETGLPLYYAKINDVDEQINLNLWDTIEQMQNPKDQTQIPATFTMFYLNQRLNFNFPV